MGQAGHHVAGADEHPSHTSSMAAEHASRTDHSVCRRKGWDKFTQEISETSDHNQCLCQDIFATSFPPLNTAGPDLNSLLVPRNFRHMLAIMKSFSATRNTMHLAGKKINYAFLLPSSTPHTLLTFLCNWNRDAPFSFLYAKLVSCHIIRAHKSLASSKEGSQAPAKASCIELAQTCIFQVLSSPTAQRTLQHHPDRALA